MTAPDVHSTSNRRVKDAAALHRRKERDRQGRYLIEGPRFVCDLLPTGALVEVFATVEAADAYGLHEATDRAGTSLTTVSDEVLDKLADSVTPQGVVAVAERRHVHLDHVVGEGMLVVLCGVSDPGNAGAIVRTATAAGAAGIVFTAGSVDPWNPKAVRASAGTVAGTPLVVDVDAPEVLRVCHEHGQRSVALDAGAERDIGEPGLLEPPVALLFGNEAHGLPDGVAAQVQVTAQVPRFGPVESLNLAAAVAVTVYAAARAARRGGRDAGRGTRPPGEEDPR